MKKSLFSGLLVSTMLFTSTSSMAGEGETDQSQVEISGTTQGNTGCAILEKHMPVKGKLLAAGVIYARTEYKVVDSFNYKMPKPKFTGRGEIDELNRLGARDKVKLVVIPSKYTPEQLNKARKLCGEPPEAHAPGRAIRRPGPELIRRHSCLVVDWALDITGRQATGATVGRVPGDTSQPHISRLLSQGEIYPFDEGATTDDRALPHWKDEVSAGSSLGGRGDDCPRAASASPAGADLAGKRFRSTLQFQRTANMS